MARYRVGKEEENAGEGKIQEEKGPGQKGSREKIKRQDTHSLLTILTLLERESLNRLCTVYLQIPSWEALV